MITILKNFLYFTGSPQPQLPDDGKLRFYSMRFCPYAQRIHLILEAKEIPHHTIFINLTEKPEWYESVSPLGKVPSLQLPNDKGHPTLTESLVIADYLDEKYPKNHLHAKDPLTKAKDKILIERFNQVVNSMYRLFFSTSGAPIGAISETVSGLDVFEKELKERGTVFFGGKQPGMLDYMIWPWCERADTLKILLGDKYELDNERFAKLVSLMS